MITVKETAVLLRVSEKTVYRWLNAGTIPHIRVGGQYRFPRNDLLAWARKNGRPLSSPFPVTEVKITENSLTTLHEAVILGGIHYQVEGRTKEEVITEVLSLIPLPATVNREAILTSIQERESLGTTGVGSGIAIPHMRYPSEILPNPQVCLCLLAHSVDWGSIDGETVKIVFVPCCPTLQDHLHLMSRISFAVRDARWQACLTGLPERSRIMMTLADIEADFIVPSR